jgi:hypothetical protein
LEVRVLGILEKAAPHHGGTGRDRWCTAEPWHAVPLQEGGELDFSSVQFGERWCDLETLGTSRLRLAIVALETLAPWNLPLLAWSPPRHPHS